MTSAASSTSSTRTKSGASRSQTGMGFRSVEHFRFLRPALRYYPPTTSAGRAADFAPRPAGDHAANTMNSATMKAVGVLPGKREVALLRHPAPRIAAPTELRIKTIEVGICGTDREICTFAYGTPPSDSDYLVLGHEAIGEVIEIGPRVTSFQPGDLVVPTVRRPCPHGHCVSCRDARQDFCFTGDFTERGIKMVHGYMTEFFVEDQTHLRKRQRRRHRLPERQRN